jgi:hypothetical protein
LREGIRLFNSGRFFECHEALEEAWLAASGEQKTFLQGLIQLAVAFHHLRRSNRHGASRLLAAGMEKLSGFAPESETVDVAALLAALKPLQEEITSGEVRPDWPAPRIVSNLPPDSSIE